MALSCCGLILWKNKLLWTELLIPGWENFYRRAADIKITLIKLQLVSLKKGEQYLRFHENVIRKASHHNSAHPGRCSHLRLCVAAVDAVGLGWGRSLQGARSLCHEPGGLFQLRERHCCPLTALPSPGPCGPLGVGRTSLIFYEPTSAMTPSTRRAGELQISQPSLAPIPAPQLLWSTETRDILSILGSRE